MSTAMAANCCLGWENVYLEMLGYRGLALGESLVFDAVGNDASLGGAVAYDEFRTPHQYQRTRRGRTNPPAKTTTQPPRSIRGPVR